MPEDIFVINAGSSSVRVCVVEPQQDGGMTKMLAGQVTGIGTRKTRVWLKETGKEVILDEERSSNGKGQDHADALRLLLDVIVGRRPNPPIGIGHRVVHGGTQFERPVRVDSAVMEYLRSLIPLAPLHQPANLAGIEVASHIFPRTPQIACFDTAFHAHRSFESSAFALPREYFERGIRRYGFHGISYEYIAQRFAELEPAASRGRVLAFHLGNGSSMCAMVGGRSVETTMGFTAVDGLIMGTRSGQLDPGVILHLLSEDGMSAAEVGDLLYKRSGLLGLSGRSSDMRDLLSADDEAARQALDCYIYRIVWHAGALAACMGGVDAMVFTAGIGENASVVRERIVKSCAWMGVELDVERNTRHGPRISRDASRVSAWAIPTDEEAMIARHLQRGIS